MTLLENEKLSSNHHQLLGKARSYLPGGTLGMFGLPDSITFVPAYGRGSKLYDVDGNEYIDYLLGSGPLILGHVHPAVVAAVQEQAAKASTFYFINEPAIELAELIVSAVPCADKVRFCSSGNEATFFAMRLARAFTGRDKVLKFEGAFHGVHDYAILSMGSAAPYSAVPRVESGGIPASVSDTVVIAPFNDIETTAAVIDANRNELAAVIVEPFQRSYPPKPGFLPFLREITSRYGIQLIFDEVVTGFRFAWGGAQEYYGVVPDLASFGKIVGGGYPLAAVAGRAEVMELCDNKRKGQPDFVYLTGTLSGNPVGAVAGLATLKELRDKNLYTRIHESTNRLRNGLKKVFAEAGIIAQVTGEGGVLQVVFTDREIVNYQDILSGDKAKAMAVYTTAARQGLFMSVPDKIYVSAVHTDEDIDRAIQAFRAGVEAIA
ncbi:MAG: aspartate aminotransferase family protein [Chloroflexota bacterium]|jgi:glutamate-1-semialdehyde 2,1-aminomutase